MSIYNRNCIPQLNVDLHTSLHTNNVRFVCYFSNGAGTRPNKPILNYIYIYTQLKKQNNAVPTSSDISVE